MAASRIGLTGVSALLGFVAALTNAEAADPAVVARTGEPARTRAEILERARTLATALAASYQARPGDGQLRRVAAMTFDTSDDQARKSRLDQLVPELILGAFARDPRFSPVERARMNDVLRELKLPSEARVDPATVAQVGRLVGAQLIVLGSISAAGPTYVVTARLVRVETGEVLGAAEGLVGRQGLVALSEDLVEIKSPSGAAFRSALLPGWGQVYSGRRWQGYAFLGTAAALATAGIANYAIGRSRESEYQKATVDVASKREDANTAYRNANLFFWFLGGVWAANVFDAYLSAPDSGSPVVDVDRIETALVPLPGGAAVSVRGRF